VGIVLILLFQLWTQPSTRILGLGNYYADYVPDRITDLLHNPAYLKINNEDIEYCLPLIYSTLRSLNSMTLNDIMTDKEFYDNEELISFGIIYPKLGVAGRYGKWQRRTGIDFGADGYLRLFGQAGFNGAFKILKCIYIGGEYNFSWNNRPDNFILDISDSLGHQHYAFITEMVWSNEVGMGFVLTHKNLWELSISGKKNYEKENFTSSIPFPFERGPEGLLTVFKAGYYDLKFNAKLRFTQKKFAHVANFSCFQKEIVRDGVNHNMDYYLTTFRPGIGTVYYPRRNILTIGSVLYEIDNINHVAYPGTGTLDKKIIGLMGFEAQLSQNIKFRFGNTLIYIFPYNPYQIKNEISFGIDIMPYENLTFNVASQNPLDYAFWFFGVSFKL
jgi:hypothetical protein